MRINAHAWTEFFLEQHALATFGLHQLKKKVWEMIFESAKPRWASRHTQEVINSSLR